MNRIRFAALLLAVLTLAGCASDARQSVFGNEPNPYACVIEGGDRLAQINLCRWTE